MKRVNVKALVLSLFIVYFIAFLGSLFTSQQVDTAWYASLRTPLTPPNWVFPVVWNILFLFIACSLYLSWTAKAKNKKQAKKNHKLIIITFGANLLLNVFWSFLFFTLKSPVLSFFELILFELSIFAMIFITYRIRKSAAYILVPYGAWVLFAGILNYLIAFG